MNTPLGLGLRHALDTVCAGFVFQLGEDPRAFHGGDDLLETAPFRLGGRDSLHPPAVCFRKTGIHAEQVAGKQGRFIPAGAGANLENDPLVVIGVLGQEQQLDIGFQLVLLGFETLQLLFGHLLHVRVGEHLPVFLDLFHNPSPATVCRDQG